MLPCARLAPERGTWLPSFITTSTINYFWWTCPGLFFFLLLFWLNPARPPKSPYPNEVADKNFNPESYDIIMLTPQQTSHIKNQSVDLTVNVHSMQEMNDEAACSYFDLVDRISKPGGMFFCANRMEKIMDGKPTRFLDYPWRSNTRTTIFEPDPLIRLVNLSPSYIRMEQYV